MMSYKEDDYMYKGYENAKKDCIKIVRRELTCVQDKHLKDNIIKDIKKLKCFGEWQT